MGKSRNGRRRADSGDGGNSALDLALAQIEKQHGKGSIMRLGEQGGVVDVAVVPTGSIALDSALGIGGVPKGRIVEIYGAEGAGKTMIALHVVRGIVRRPVGGAVVHPPCYPWPCSWRQLTRAIAPPLSEREVARPLLTLNGGVFWNRHIIMQIIS